MTVRFVYDEFSTGNYYLVNTSGNIQKKKLSGLKDGNECYYYVDDKMHVILYTDNKTLKSKDGTPVKNNDGKEFVDYLKEKNNNNETDTTPDTTESAEENPTEEATN